MNTGKIIFSQLMELIPHHEFHSCVKRYQGEYRMKSFSCYDQFLCMAFAQLTYRESLRDIETCLRSVSSELYHMGFRCPTIARSTLAKANENRDWRIYADFAMHLMQHARTLYRNEPLAVELDQTIYALDSTTIDLCLSFFPRAQFRQQKSAVKLHTLLDLRGNIPHFLVITEGSVHDVNILDQIPIEAGSVYIMDRGYIDYQRLYHIHQHHALLVIRAKDNLQCRGIHSHPVDPATGIWCDQTIRLAGRKARCFYPEPLRRIHYYDSSSDHYLVVLTNDFFFPACTIAKVYRSRWQVE